MRHYAEKTREATRKDCSQEEGAGAAGGLGFAFLSWFPHAVLKPGVEIVLDAVNLEPQIRMDLVVTGEGRLDGQTAMGKLPAGVAALAKNTGKQFWPLREVLLLTQDGATKQHRRLFPGSPGRYHPGRSYEAGDGQAESQLCPQSRPSGW